MRCRFSSIGRRFSFLLMVLFGQATFAQLDWQDNVVVFGSGDDESLPLITSMHNGQYRAFCLRNSFDLSTRRSHLNGSAWESFSDLEVALSNTEMGAESDIGYSYVWSKVEGNIRRIAHENSTWSELQILSLDSTVSAFSAINLTTDFAFDPVDTYLHGCYLHSQSPTNAVLAYFRSEDHAATVSFRSQIQSNLQLQDSSSSLATAVSWSGEEEKIWTAVTVDRPGTTGEQILFFNSENFGQSWSAPIIVDSSSYAMMHPSMTAQDELIMMAYQRRNNASIAREIFMVYSPDNGMSWSEPLQLTDNPFDDFKPRLLVSGERLGLFYVRAQTQNDSGALFFREASLGEPWNWSPEVSVSENSSFKVSQGYAATSDDNGFAAVWSSRVVGEDNDILFNASWRGVAVEDQFSQSNSETPQLSYTRAGFLQYDLPRGIPSEIVLYDLLGRKVAQSTLSGRGVWSLPSNLPSGNYWAKGKLTNALRVQVVR
jgi:hypothetical protein